MVTGAAGQLGGVICEQFGGGHDDYDVTALTRADLDLTDHDAVQRAVHDTQPGLIINCAAYNRVDDAEDDAVAALAVNAFAVRSLARAATRVGAILVHYSTDFVFDGTAGVPYTEADEPNPGNVYGSSKLIGEWFALDVPSAYVIRVESLFGGSPARSSVDWIIDAILGRREVRVFTDRIVSPSYVHDVARATRSLVESDAATGLFHCVNSGHGTWWEVAEEIARQVGAEPRLVPASLETARLRAARPRYCALSNAKLSAAGVALKSWQDALRRHLRSRRSVD
jgi:dTDP-4-dehydrorhamnose reductase|tara:strand:- start:3352 stop:4200 length:849 start_codon:yes stop_codon:yes gene_type:complete